MIEFVDNAFYFSSITHKKSEYMENMQKWGAMCDDLLLLAAKNIDNELIRPNCIPFFEYYQNFDVYPCKISGTIARISVTVGPHYTRLQATTIERDNGYTTTRGIDCATVPQGGALRTSYWLRESLQGVESALQEKFVILDLMQLRDRKPHSLSYLPPEESNLQGIGNFVETFTPMQSCMQEILDGRRIICRNSCSSQLDWQSPLLTMRI